MDENLAVMTPEHPRWSEFYERLSGPEGCDFEEAENVLTTTWRCGGGYDKTYATAILTAMGGIDVPASLAYFEQHGGHCDCEILFNVAPPSDYLDDDDEDEEK